MSTRRPRILLLLALVIAAVVIATVVLTGQPEEEASTTSAFDPSVPTSTRTPPPAGSATPTGHPADPADGSDATDPADPADPADPSGAPSTPGPSLAPQERAEISEGASQTLTVVLDRTAEIDPSVPDDVVGDLSDVATRGYLSELESERLEFEAEGWTREGDYTVGDVEVLEHSSTSTGEVATVRVCVDSSEIVIRRADGEVIEASPTSARAWNIVVLERIDAADWRIVGRTFPDDPAC